MEDKNPHKEVVEENPELTGCFGCSGFIAIVAWTFALVFFNKLALSLAIISTVICFLVLITFMNELKKKQKQ